MGHLVALHYILLVTHVFTGREVGKTTAIILCFWNGRLKV